MKHRTQKKSLTVSLISSTQNPLSIVEESARITRGIESTNRTETDYFHLLYKMGHYSVFEHISFSFRIEGISRACSHQLVRFRIGVSFTQRSQRYTDESSLPVLVPPSIEANPAAHTIYQDALQEAQTTYQRLLALGISKEDARFILPNAAATSLIMTMNYRELLHAAGLRLCSKAQWEIQDLFRAITREMATAHPLFAEYLQPKCVHQGFCSESKPCKSHDQIQQEWKKLQK